LSNPYYGSEVWLLGVTAGGLLWLLAFLTAGMTAFYMWRLVFLTFFGQSRVDHEAAHHIHESPRVMLVPLGVLALLSVIGGWVGWPQSLWPRGLGQANWFERWLEPVFAREAVGAEAAPHPAHFETAEYALMLLAVALAAAGVALAYQLYVRRPEQADQLQARLPRAYNLLLNKYYVDEIYSATFVEGPILGKKLGSALSAFDDYVVDGGVNGAGWLTRLFSRVSIFWDTWVVDGAVNLLAFFTRVASFPVRMLQTGFVQSYALLIVLGVLAFFGYYLLR